MAIRTLIRGGGNRPTPEPWAPLARLGTVLTVPAGWAPLVEGTPGAKVYLVLEGQAAVHRGGAQVAVVGPGELLGEAALARNKLRNATVVALTSLRVIHFTRSQWARAQKESVALRELVSRTLKARQ